MSALILRNRCQRNTTLIENEFIDKYMIAANGEYVKVYLILLRHLNDPSFGMSISQLADLLECTEGDILRALKYWEKEGLLALEYNSENTVTGVSMGKGAKAPVQEPVQEEPVVPAASVVREPVKTPVPAPQPKSTPIDRKELQQLLFVAEQYLGKTLTKSDIESINYFYDNLGFSVDLIEYLIEYCVENGHRSMHYIQKVAIAWSEQHITTVDQAKNTSALYNKICYSILNAYGIKGRGPACGELALIRKWTEDMAFDLEIVIEACNRTMSAIHQPSFEYTDRILTNWKAKNVHTLADIVSVDSSYAQDKIDQQKANRRSSNPSSKFRNFEEHSYNMDELTKELLGNH